MNNYLTNLNAEQLEVVETVGQPVRVIAGAGSGKTKTLISKITYLIDKIGLDANRICAVTFTNKATAEMKKRLEEYIGPMARYSWILTYHALCKRILKEDIEVLGYNKNFVILSSSEQTSILRKLSKKLNHFSIEDFNFKIAKAKVLDWHGKNFKLQDARDDYNDSNIELFNAYWNLLREYNTYKKNNNTVDFDDLLFLTSDLLNNHSSVCKKWQNRFDYILVDEFQDTNQVQFDIIKKINGFKKGLTVVGDPDQTIYTWRGADIKIILDIENTFVDCKTIILNKNYRSTKDILDLSNFLIAKNSNRVKKELVSVKQKGSKPLVYKARNEFNEASWVCETIESLKKENNYKYSDFTILYRLSRQSNKIENELKQFGIDYEVVGGTNFFSRVEVVRIINWLKAIALHNDLAIINLVGEEKGVGPAAVNQIEEIAYKNHWSIFELLTTQIFSIPTSIKNKLNDFITIFNLFLNNIDNLSVLEFCSNIVYKTKIKEFYIKQKEEYRNENINELLITIKQFYDSIVELEPDITTKKVIMDYLDVIALDMDANNNSEEIVPKVQLMTIHTAKGLENKVVFIVGANEQWFPGNRSSKNMSALEEERRLMYVAITRAEEKLFISYNQLITSWQGGEDIGNRSRFIDDFNSNHYEEKEDESLQSYGIPPANNFNDSLVPVNSLWKLGDKVSHPIFGTGEVIQLIAANIIVNFGEPYNKKVLRGTSSVIEAVS